MDGCRSGVRGVKGGGGLKECDRQWADISVSDQRVEDNFMVIRCRPTHRSKLHSAVWLRYLHWFLFYFTLFHFILFYSILFHFILFYFIS